MAQRRTSGRGTKQQAVAALVAVGLLVGACDLLLPPRAATPAQPTAVLATQVVAAPTPLPVAPATAMPLPATLTPGAVALRRCEEERFGLAPDYQETGPLHPATLAASDVPAERYPTLRSSASTTSAVYGITSDGGFAVAHLPAGMGGGTAQDSAAPSLCYLQFVSVHGAYTDAASALDLLLDTFAGVPRERGGYRVIRTRHGYAFVRRVAGGHGRADRSAATVRLEAYRAAEGTLILSALSEDIP